MSKFHPQQFQDYAHTCIRVYKNDFMEFNLSYVSMLFLGKCLIRMDICFSLSILSLDINSISSSGSVTQYPVLFELRYKNSLLLNAQHRIGVKIGQVDLFSLLFDVRMFTLKEPTHVREKEPSFRIMWVGVSFCKLMMHSVVAAPFYYIALQYKVTRLRKHVHAIFSDFFTAVKTIIFI